MAGPPRGAIPAPSGRRRYARVRGMSRLDRSSLAQLVLMRVREFLREPEALFWTFFFPVLLALVLGIAFRDAAPEPVLVAVERTEETAGVMASLEEAGMQPTLLSADSADAALRAGRVAVVVVPGPDTLTYRYDPGRPESRSARLRIDDALQRGAGRTDPLPVRQDPVEERGSRYIDFLIPGLIGLNLLSTGIWGVGYTVVRMRSEHLLKRFVASPMSRWQFLLSFMLGRLVFLLPELILLIGFAWLVFGVGVQGSVLFLALVAALGAFSFTGLGVLVASRARTTEGLTGISNLIAVPQWVVSGVFFSTERFPEVVRPLIDILPLTALVDALRAVMNEGAGLQEAAVPIGIVLLWGVVCFGAAVRIFRWR